jgi:hypothetical protein
MIAPSEPRSSRSLADSSPGDLLKVRLIAFEFSSTPCWRIRLRAGDVIQCLDSDPEQTIVARANGEELTIPEGCARFITVDTLQSHLTPPALSEDTGEGDSVQQIPAG